MCKRLTEQEGKEILSAIEAILHGATLVEYSPNLTMYTDETVVPNVKGIQMILRNHNG